MTESDRPRVVVVGAGFGGLWTARRLAREPVDVLVLDRNNYHTFLPLLYQVAAAELGPTDIAYPVRSVFRRAPNVDFRMAEVVEVDADTKHVHTPLERIPYDHLVLALGSTSHFFGIEGAEEHAFPLRTMEEAIPLRHHILSRFETAMYATDPELRRRLLSFVVVGAGPTGVEFTGALEELLFGPLQRDYPRLDRDDPRIVLVEAMDQVLPGMPEELGNYARRRLERKNVDVRTGSMVERVRADRVLLDDGEEIPSDTIVWTAGVRGAPRAAAWGFPVADGGRIQVTDTLQVPGTPDVWIVGDLAHVEGEDGRPLPQIAPAAIQEGEHAAENVLRAVRGREPRPFHYDDPGMLAVIGRNAGVARVGGRTFTGFFAWLLWLAVHLVKLIGFRNRVLVLVNWAWNYLSYERAVRLILPFGPGTSFERGVAGGPREPPGSGEAPVGDRGDAAAGER